jgi:hypothetical protein
LGINDEVHQIAKAEAAKEKVLKEKEAANGAKNDGK